MVVANVHIKEYNGSTSRTNPPATQVGDAAGVTDDVANINLVSIDQAEASSSANPVTAGTRSVSKWLAYELHAINSSNKIDNFQVWYTPQATTTGVTYFSNLNTSLALTTSIYPAPPTNTDFTGAGEGDVETATAMAFGDPAAENIGVSESGAAGLSVNGAHSDLIAIQFDTTGASPPGNVPQKTVHFQYDEQ
ncbi:hypothetical protein LCGC14_0368570 [marine sediment metagenome]|uniref:Uncharacterized protein n=1 Tax=marine sediment metagenome TaxID=412755 RepID=A0A0F9T5Y8_9ZZZZ